MQFENHVRKSAPEPGPAPLCDRIVAAMAATASYILNSFALHAVCLHPELNWSMLEELNRKKTAKTTEPDSPPVNNVAQFRPRRRVG